MATPKNKHGWFTASRGEEPLEVIAANPLAYVLAAVISHRARWKPNFTRFPIALGEAFLGDYWNYGMTEQEYRTSKEQLQQWGFATFKATNKGTIGKLTDTRLFSVFPAHVNGQLNIPATSHATNEQRTSNEPATNEQRLTKNRRKKKTGYRGDAPSSASCEVPQFEAVKLGLWPREYDAMLKHAQDAIKAVRSKPESFARDMTKAAEDLIDFLEKEKPDGYRQRIDAALENPDSFERKDLKPKPAAIVQAWRDRIEEIKRAKAGIKN
jgi:hypothetical protein